MSHKLFNEARKREIRIPTARTLAKYGLKPSDWLQLLNDQGWVCAVCKTSNSRWNTDHEHVAGWSKKPDHERRRYVRGVLCWHCNKFIVHSNLSAELSKSITAYLHSYERRRDA